MRTRNHRDKVEIRRIRRPLGPGTTVYGVRGVTHPSLISPRVRIAAALRRPRWGIAVVAAAIVLVLVVIAGSSTGRDAGSAGASLLPAPTGIGASPSPTPPAFRRTDGPPGSPPAGSTVGPALPDGPTAAATAATTEAPSSGDATAGIPLAELLGALRIADERRTGYDRDLFKLWIDADGDGCDTRREVLVEEAVIAPRVGEGCALSGGSWFSLYDGVTITDSSALDIDHVVALAEAWDSGAFAWTAERRRDFANDLGVSFALIAVSAASNRSKSDLDPADWLPPSATARCPFVGAWIAVKVRWSLAVDAREQSALESLAAGCPATRMVVEPAPTATPGPSPMATTTAKASEACDAAYPTICIPPPPPDLDCAEVTFRDFVVLAPDPHRLDGDGDGLGCER